MNIGGGGAPPNPPNHYPQITGGSNREQTVAVNTPVTLSVQATDDGIPKPRKPRPNATTPPPKTGTKVVWQHYRGAGKVQFSVEQTEPVYGAPLNESTQATFDTPGTYVVRALVTDGLLPVNYDMVIHVK